MRVALLLLVACGEPKPTVSTPTVPSTPLPSDDALGELALMPVPRRDPDSWLPEGAFPVLPEEAMRKGKPSWLAVDTGGSEATLTYGSTVDIPYGCDGGTMQATRLEGLTGGAMKPGLVWLRPTTATAWKPSPVAITEGPKAQTKRAYRFGEGGVKLDRTQPRSGVAEVTWKTARHALRFERHDMDGADNAAPMDLADPSIGQPIPEAAWSFSNGDAVLVVFRVPSYEGINFKTVVLSASSKTGREVASMTMYLYVCAF